MTKEEREVMRMALEALEDISSFQNHTNGNSSDADKAITAIEKCLANDALEKKAENARELGLDYESEEEPLHPVHIGVDVTKEGTAVTAFYRKPDAMMEMFYSQFHPMAQPEQEPVALVYDPITESITPLQRTWVGLTDEEREEIALEVPMDAVLITEAKLKEKNVPKN